MRPMTLSEIAQAVQGRLVGADATIDAVAIDSRALPQHARVLFVALKGERFDGHDHVASAADAGIVAALVSRELEASVPQIVVEDTERALARLAAHAQRTRSTKVVAITGSNGKTSVKTLVLSILDCAGRAYANPGNRNNEIGLPLAVLDAPEDAQFAVYEMGAGKPGDIAYLCGVVRPDASIVNNVAAAHIERLGSLLGVADTKAAIYDALPADGTGIVNADDAFAPYFETRLGGRRVLRFALDVEAEFTARDIEVLEHGSRFTMVTPQGEADITLAMPGRHNVRNALAAAALASAVGVPLNTLAQGLCAAQPVAGRLIARRHHSGALVIDDSYNANPGSVAAAIDTLAAAPGEAWLVLGDMRELGADAEGLHADMGRRAKQAGLTRLYTLGALSEAASRAFGEGAMHFGSHEALASALAPQLRDGVRVLVKGSRGSAMDRIVAALLPVTGDAAHKGGDHAA